MTAHGALISPKLSALVHASMGKASAAADLHAVTEISADLLCRIQEELENVFRRGQLSVTTGGGGGGGGGGSGAFTPGAGGTIHGHPTGGGSGSHPTGDGS